MVLVNVYIGKTEMFIENATGSTLKSLFQAFRLWGQLPERCEQEKGKNDEGVGVGSHMHFFPSTHSTTKKAKYWESKKGQLAKTINTKVSGKVHLKSSICLTYFRSVFLLTKSKTQKNCRVQDHEEFFYYHRSWCHTMRIQRQHANLSRILQF